VFGAAWQQGLIPLSEAAILRAIALNATGVEANASAFRLGRWAVLHPDQAAAVAQPVADAAVDPVAYRAAHLTAYQNAALAARYLALVGCAPTGLRDAVARGYHKLLACKDEYEVARLHLATVAKARAEFDGDFQARYHLAPPILSGKGADGRPKKREFGAWIVPVFGLLAALKGLRGTRFDPFAFSAERRLERRLIVEYEADMAEVLPAVTPATEAVARELAELPLMIRGFGPVKLANAAKAAKRRETLLAAFRTAASPAVAAE